MVKRILYTGQSNALGRALGGIWPADPAVTFWNNRNDLLDMTCLGSGWITPLRSKPPFSVNYDNCPAYHFGRYLAQNIDEEVRIVLVGDGGEPISRWAKTGVLYQRIAAIQALIGCQFDGMVYDQGEANETTSGIWSSAFAQFLADMADDGIMPETAPVVLCTLAPRYVNMNPVIRSMGSDRIKIADITSLPLLSDEVHFTASASADMGRIAAAQMHDLLLTPWNHDMTVKYLVSAAGCSAVTFPNNADRKIPLAAFSGDASYIVDGSFVAKETGTHRFHSHVYTASSKTRAKLLDASGSELRYNAYSGDVSSQIPGNHSDIFLNIGDVVSLGAFQGSGATTSISEAIAAKYCRMSVDLLDECVSPI